MKKLFISLLALLLLVGCAPQNNSHEAENLENSQDQTAVIPVPEKDKEITLSAGFVSMVTDDPESYVKDFTSGEQSEYFTSAKLNEDGSVTFVMAAEKYNEYISNMKAELDSTLEEMINDKESYPNVENITYSSDMTTFNVTLSKSEVSFGESFMAFALYIYGATFQMFSEKPNDLIDVNVNYYDPNGNIIESGKMSDMMSE